MRKYMMYTVYVAIQQKEKKISTENEKKFQNLRCFWLLFDLIFLVFSFLCKHTKNK